MSGRRQQPVSAAGSAQSRSLEGLANGAGPSPLTPAARSIWRCAAVAIALPLLLPAEDGPPAPLTPVQQEDFLRTAKVVQSRPIGKGVTHAARVTLEKDGFRHDAEFQTSDVAMAEFRTATEIEVNFKDTYKFNIAAYRLAVLLGLADMVPVSVERRIQGRYGALVWWIDDVEMDERQRVATKTESPDQTRWNRELEVVHVFDELIANTDRNMGNIIIDKQWRIWMIDHTRAFRTHTWLLKPQHLRHCDRALLERMRALTDATLKEQLSPWVNSLERKGLLARRDIIVRFFDDGVAKTSAAAVLIDRPARN